MISIIITAFKEERTIGKAIESVLKNELQEDYEVLVFAPDEKTLSVIEKYSKQNKKVRGVKDSGEGKPAALNMAFKIAKGKILVLTDGDVYISEKAIPLLLKSFNDSKVGAVSGRPVSLNSKNNVLGFWSHLLTNIANKRREQALQTKKRFYCSGYLYAIRKKLVQEIPKNTLSDDGLISHFVYSQGYKIDYCPKAEVYVKYPTTLKDWINQKRRSAGGYNQIKQWTKIEMRSFLKESSGIFGFFEYIKTLKEFFWFVELVFVRIYLWILIYKDINLSEKKFEKIWVRIDSTK